MIQHTECYFLWFKKWSLRVNKRLTFKDQLPLQRGLGTRTKSSWLVRGLRFPRCLLRGLFGWDRWRVPTVGACAPSRGWSLWCDEEAQGCEYAPMYHGRCAEECRGGGGYNNYNNIIYVACNEWRIYSNQGHSQDFRKGEGGSRYRAIACKVHMDWKPRPLIKPHSWVIPSE